MQRATTSKGNLSTKRVLTSLKFCSFRRRLIDLTVMRDHGSSSAWCVKHSSKKTSSLKPNASWRRRQRESVNRVARRDRDVFRLERWFGDWHEFNWHEFNWLQVAEKPRTLHSARHLLVGNSHFPGCRPGFGAQSALTLPRNSQRALYSAHLKLARDTC